MLVVAAFVIGDANGEGIVDGFTLGEVLNDGGFAVGAVVEGVVPLTGIAVERNGSVGAVVGALDGPGGGSTVIDVA